MHRHRSLKYSEPRAADFSQTEYYADRRDANHRSRHWQKNLRGCADALASTLSYVKVTGHPLAKRAANAACSIGGLKPSPDKMQHRWNGDDHESERTHDSKVQFQMTPLGKDDPCRHHQPKCEASEGHIDEWAELI